MAEKTLNIRNNVTILIHAKYCDIEDCEVTHCTPYKHVLKHVMDCEEDEDCTALIEQFGHQTAQLIQHIMDHQLEKQPTGAACRIMSPAAGTKLGMKTFCVLLAKENSSPFLTCSKKNVQKLENFVQKRAGVSFTRY